MNDTLLDIREKLKNNYFQNEEHVKLSLVARILFELGWNIWNPLEVNSEFKVVPKEDSTKVDIALFLNKYFPPSVFIEIKSVGKIDRELAKIEEQLRDYNRNNTAQFSIITDGRKWKFYYSQTGGEFSEKCFESIDIMKDDIIDIIESFNIFLSKENINNDSAKIEAERLLKLNQKQRALEDAFPKAKRMISDPPFPSLPEALVDVVSKSGFNISLEEAKSFAANYVERKPQPVEIIKVNDRRKVFRKKVKKNTSFPPNGTKCRFKYKNRMFEGIISNDHLNVEGHGSFTSFSRASVKITNTSRNGWLDWELKLPNSNIWQIADDWRKSIETTFLRDVNTQSANNKLSWIHATKNAILRYCNRHGSDIFTLNGLISEELENIIQDTQTKGKTPINTLQYYLQILRDQSDVEFLDNHGSYRFNQKFR